MSVIRKRGESFEIDLRKDGKRFRKTFKTYEAAAAAIIVITDERIRISISNNEAEEIIKSFRKMCEIGTLKSDLRKLKEALNEFNNR
jgi:hypothetical protein